MTATTVGDDGGTFHCDFCGGDFKKGRTDAEALEEMAQDEGYLPVGQRAVACEDCYRKVKAAQAARGGAMNPEGGIS